MTKEDQFRLFCTVLHQSHLFVTSVRRDVIHVRQRAGLLLWYQCFFMAFVHFYLHSCWWSHPQRLAERLSNSVCPEGFQTDEREAPFPFRPVKNPRPAKNISKINKTEMESWKRLDLDRCSVSFTEIIIIFKQYRVVKPPF